MQKDAFKYGDKILNLEAETYIYDGYWGANGKGFSAETINRVRALPLGSSMNAEMTRYRFTIDYLDKDYQRWVVRDLAKVAAVIFEAYGEIRCRFVNQSRSAPQELFFEYYTVSPGKLWRQPGMIARAERKLAFDE